MKKNLDVDAKEIYPPQEMIELIPMGKKNPIQWYTLITALVLFIPLGLFSNFCLYYFDEKIKKDKLEPNNPQNNSMLGDPLRIGGVCLILIFNGVFLMSVHFIIKAWNKEFNKTKTKQ